MFTVVVGSGLMLPLRFIINNRVNATYWSNRINNFSQFKSLNLSFTSHITCSMIFNISVLITIVHLSLHLPLRNYQNKSNRSN